MAVDNALVIAIAGGAGGFLGAAVGQGIQWLKELQTERRVDRRRAEDVEQATARERRDRRFEEYLLIQAFLQEYADSLRKLDMIAWGWSGDVHNQYPKLKDAVQEALDKTKTLALHDLSKATARAHVVGSDELRTSMTDLTAASVVVASFALTTTVNTLSEGAFEELQRRRAAGENVDPENLFTESEIPWTQVAQTAHETAQRTLKHVGPIQQVIRRELDLA